jgi:alpha-beta hydrolase superfamily lysophospholipase/phosphatidylglycerophosphate synthase/ubiquinone/menaquinone biosynthesis C-methylase UbiE
MSEYQPSARRPIADLFRATARHSVQLRLRLRIDADLVSYASMIAAAGAGLCFWRSGHHLWLLILAVALCFLRLWMNMLDGMVAIAAGTASRRGEILNELPDRISDVLIFVGVAHSGLCHPMGGYWAAIFSLLTAYVGLFGQALGVQRQFGGVMSKPWRMVTLSVGATLALALGLARRSPNQFLAGLTILDWTHVVIIAGCVQTCWVRLSRILLELPSSQGRTSDPPNLQQCTTPAYGVKNETAAAPMAPSEHTLTLWDGTELFYRAWMPTMPTKKAVILFHRGHEHSGRFQDVLDELGLQDVAVFAWDARGHGRSPGDRGYAPSFASVVKDADFFVRHIEQTFDKRLQDMVVLGHSVGAVTAAAWIHDYAPPVRGLVLVTPALRVKLYIPLAVPGLRLLQKIKRGGRSFVKSYIKASMLTHDPEQARRYDSDPFIARSIAVNILLDLHDTGTRLIDDAGAIRVPTLLLTAGRSDWVVRLDAQQKFFKGLGSRKKRMRVFEGLYHDILHERHREPVLNEIRQFVVELFDGEVPPADLSQNELLAADRFGYTRQEYEDLSRPLAPLSPKACSFAIQRFTLKTLGRLSDGIDLGWRSGFDSGQSLDYVYQNSAQGRLGVGKLIDRIYLDSVGWTGVRQRKRNLQKQLYDAIAKVKSAGHFVRILDVAAGPGRYLLGILKDLPPGDVSAQLRDINPANLAVGQNLAKTLGLSGVTFQQGDAFDEQSLAAVEQTPNVVIVSGLYELFPDNSRVLSSLRGLARAMRDGGYLVYTGQPWHPQIEMIARVLTNRNGVPWVMRRRTQAELDCLVNAAGFEKVGMEIDEWGIFTVSLAKIGGVP